MQYSIIDQKEVLGHKVRLLKNEKTGAYRIDTDIPHLADGGLVHWWGFSEEQEARDAYDCVNDNKVFILTNVEPTLKNYPFLQAHKLVTQMIVRRIR